MSFNTLNNNCMNRVFTTVLCAMGIVLHVRVAYVTVGRVYRERQHLVAIPPLVGENDEHNDARRTDRTS